MSTGNLTPLDIERCNRIAELAARIDRMEARVSHFDVLAEQANAEREAQLIDMRAAGKLTDWFPASTKPAHVGVYPVKTPRADFRASYWDGEQWGYACPKIETAVTAASLGMRSSFQDFQWAGLTNCPWPDLALSGR